MIYTDKESPKVSTSVKFKKAKIEKKYVDPAREHMKLFVSNLYKFASWLNDPRLTTKDELAILSRMRLLSDISNCPQLSTINQHVGIKWKDITKKQQTLIDIIDKHVRNKEQIIVFTERRETSHQLSHIISNETETLAIPIVVAGDDIDVRNRKLDRFREGSADVLMGTYRSIGRGYNLPQASVVILYELFWTPDIMTQAIGRVLREQQRKDPTVYLIINRGMIDEYQVDEIVMARQYNLAIMIEGKQPEHDLRIRSYKEVARDMVNYLQSQQEESDNENQENNG